jgi:putative methionine-R-sulfoxide reductase with GAF domain
LLGLLPPVLLPVVTVITTAVAAVNSGHIRVYWSLGAVAATLGNGAWNMMKERNARAIEVQAVVAKSNLAMALFDGGQPLLVALTRVASADDVDTQKTALSVLTNRIVDLASSELGLQRKPPCKMRATFYRLRDDKLIREEWQAAGGRPAAPRELTDADVIELARNGENAILVDDVSKPNSSSTIRFNDCASYIVVPVRSESTAHGLLFADADCPHRLTDIDKGLLILMAGMLAVGLEQASSTVRWQKGCGQSTT